VTTQAPARRVHFIGICGYAVSGAALLAKQLGYAVSGSDEFAYPPTTDTITKAGIPWVNQHSAENIDRFGVPDLVVVGNQTRAHNPEWEEVRRRGLAHTSEAEFWAELTATRLRLAVCGTHGKTTTAALLALMLDRAGMSPGFRLGAGSRDFGISARLGEGRPFVIEGDEYTTAPWDRRPKFLHAHPQAACVTRLEHDHPDVYPTFADYRAPFVTLARSMPGDGLLVLFADEPACLELRDHASCRVLTYGEGATAEWRIGAVDEDGREFELSAPPPQGSVRVRLGVPGAHNRQNAVAALALALYAGAPIGACLEACEAFQGASRRFEVVATVGGITVVDDYGHHPTEVEVTVRAARERYPTARLLVVNVPHTYSRTREFLEEYGHVFAGADLVVLGPIEAARERHLPATVSSEDVARRSRAAGIDTMVVADADAAVSAVVADARPGDVVLCISLGGFDQVAQRLVAALEARGGG
jgi:UDP-N-acetylmuramate--L-alanine ligase